MLDATSASLLALDEATLTIVDDHAVASAQLYGFQAVPAVFHAPPSFPISFFQAPFARFPPDGD